MSTIQQLKRKGMRCRMMWIVALIVAASASSGTATASATHAHATRELSIHRISTLGIPRGGDETNNTASINNTTKYSEEDPETAATRPDDPILPPPSTTVKKKLGHRFGMRGKHQRFKQQTVAYTTKMNEKIEEARRIFLDRMAAVGTILIDQERDATLITNNNNNNNDTTFFFQQPDGDDDDIAPQSDLCLPNRSIYVVTTAALPWRTGTAVNPLLRAAYLSRRVKEINSNDNHFNQTTITTSLDEHASCEVCSDGLDQAPITKQQQRQMVTLVIPWLELEEDRLELYGPDHVFANPQEQETYIREWLRHAAMEDAADSKTGIRILFYPARYHSGLKSIFAMGDICAVLRNQKTDDDGDDSSSSSSSSLADAVCILEEPEHLNWYRAPGEGWTKVFGYVVGIVHTNYVEYAGTQFHGLWTAPAIQVMSSAMIRAYCHKVIKLSGVLQSYAPEKECIKNVHGVREDFLREGRRRRSSLNTTDLSPDNNEAESKVYYIGKILWAKGFEQMLELEEFYYKCTGKYFAVDIYGGGPETEEIQRAFHGRRNNKKSKVTRSKSDLEDLHSFSREYIAKKLRSIKISSQEFDIPKTMYELLRRRPIPATFMGPVDHASLGERYKVFVNPSVSEVLCTTTFEALAMGKFAIIPVHESNKFFLQFPNCLGYKDKWEFAASLRWALTHEPEPLTPELANEFTWEAATDRLIRASAITRREARERAMLGKAKLDEMIAFFHHELGKGTKGDALRKFLGGGPISDQVKYEMAKQGLDQEGSENEGLTDKFKSSSFVRAIKSSLRAGGSLEGPAYFAT